VRALTAAYRPPSIAERARAAARAEGLISVAGRALFWLAQYAVGIPRAAVGAEGTFTFDSARHRYLVHPHRWTWLNERAVEVPIARTAVERRSSGRILEVGNVLSHYSSIDHLVIDRYERAPGVINRDVLGFEDQRGFDLIVSVSTLEHIGWDEAPRQSGAAERAFAHLVGLLAPGGELLVTVPVGYNRELDAALRAGRIPLTGLRALRRRHRRNIWREADPAEIWDVRYDSLLCTAHAILVCSARRAA
jgi:SAM-dependent methyltransferase